MYGIMLIGWWRCVLVRNIHVWIDLVVRQDGEEVRWICWVGMTCEASGWKLATSSRRIVARNLNGSKRLPYEDFTTFRESCKIWQDH